MLKQSRAGACVFASIDEMNLNDKVYDYFKMLFLYTYHLFGFVRWIDRKRRVIVCQVPKAEAVVHFGSRAARSRGQPGTIQAIIIHGCLRQNSDVQIPTLFFIR